MGWCGGCGIAVPPFLWLLISTAHICSSCRFWCSQWKRLLWLLISTIHAFAACKQSSLHPRGVARSLYLGFNVWERPLWLLISTTHICSARCMPFSIWSGVQEAFVGYSYLQLISATSYRGAHKKCFAFSLAPFCGPAHSRCLARKGLPGLPPKAVFWESGFGNWLSLWGCSKTAPAQVA